jgi:predicted RNA methylase
LQGSSYPGFRALGQQTAGGTKDALAEKHGEYDIVLTNPPFGKRAA